MASSDKVTTTSPPLSDEEHLAKLGYKQEFFRHLGLFDNWAATFTCINFVGGIPVLFGWAMATGGPAAAFANWTMVGGLSLAVALVLAEIAAAFPTAGGIYFWAFRLGGARWGPFLAWMTAWWNWAGWVCVVPGVQQGATGFVLGALEVAYPHRADLWGDAWFGWALTAAGLVVAMLPNLLPQRALKLWLRFAVGLFFGLLALYWTWFPAMAAVGGHHFQTPAGVFGRFHNGVNTGGDGEAAASDAYCWTVGLLFGAWVFYGYDTSAHLAEETHDASATVAKGMWLSTLSAWALSVPTLVLVLFCIQDFPALLAAPYANNFTAYLVQLLGPRGAVVVLALLAANATCGSASCFLSAQRVTFAISRDGVLPGSRVLRRLTRRHRVPAAAALLVLAVALVVASAPLALGSAADVAMAAVAAAATAATNLSYLIPLAARYTVGRAAFRPAPALRLGRAGSWLLAPVAAAWIGFLFVVLLLPQRYPVSARSLNYAPVCVGIVAVASVVGWVAPWGLGGRYWFAGPRRTLGDVVDAGEDVLT